MTSTFPIDPAFADAGTLHAVEGDLWRCAGEAAPSTWAPDYLAITAPGTGATFTATITRTGRVQYQEPRRGVWKERIRIHPLGGESFLGWGFFRLSEQERGAP
jgi:hypothetical protein